MRKRRYYADGGKVQNRPKAPPKPVPPPPHLGSAIDAAKNYEKRQREKMKELGI